MVIITLLLQNHVLLKVSSSQHVVQHVPLPAVILAL